MYLFLICIIFPSQISSWTTNKKTALVHQPKTSVSSRKALRSTSHRYPAATSHRAALRTQRTAEPTRTPRRSSPTTITINHSKRTTTHRRQATPPILISLPPLPPHSNPINTKTTNRISRTITIHWPLPLRRLALPHRPVPDRLSCPTIRRLRSTQHQIAIRPKRPPHRLVELIRKRRLRLRHRQTTTTIKRVAVNHKRRSTRFTVDTVRKRQRSPRQPISRHLLVVLNSIRTDTPPKERSDNGSSLSKHYTLLFRFVFFL